VCVKYCASWRSRQGIQARRSRTDRPMLAAPRAEPTRHRACRGLLTPAGESNAIPRPRDASSGHLQAKFTPFPAGASTHGSKVFLRNRHTSTQCRLGISVFSYSAISLGLTASRFHRYHTIRAATMGAEPAQNGLRTARKSALATPVCAWFPTDPWAILPLPVGHA